MRDFIVIDPTGRVYKFSDVIREATLSKTGRQHPAKRKRYRKISLQECRMSL